MSENKLSAKERLQWLGLSQAVSSLSSVEAQVNLLLDALPGYDTFQDHLNNGYDYNNNGSKESITTFNNFTSYLLSLGFTQNQIDRFISIIKENFTDDNSNGTVFDEFKSYVINDTGTWEEFKNAFSSSNETGGEVETENGETAAGIRFHDESGVTKDNVNVPAGTTEIFGREVHFSQTESVSTEDDSDSSTFTFSNIRTDGGNTTVDVDTTATIKADVTNNNSQNAPVGLSFIEDGSKIDGKVKYIAGNSTETVSFDITKSSQEYHDYAINTTATITITWKPENIQ